MEIRQDIFISYSSKNQLQANSVCRYLEDYGFSCWIASRDIKPGEDYPTAITDAVRSSRAMVVLISRDSIHSMQVKKELTLANGMEKYGMKLFMIMLDDTLDPERLNSSFDYILAGIQACWWTKRGRREEIILQLASALERQVELVEEMVPQEYEEHRRRQKFERPVETAMTKEEIPLDHEDGSYVVTLRKNRREKKNVEQTAERSENRQHRKTIFYSKNVKSDHQKERELRSTQATLAGILVALCLFGLLMIGSASFSWASEELLDGYYYLKRQILMMSIGVGVLLVMRRLSLSFLKKVSPWLFGLAVVSVLLLRTALSYGNYGLMRWLQIGQLRFRPADLFVPAFILLLAWWMEREWAVKQRERLILILWGVSAASGVLFCLVSYQWSMLILLTVLTFGMTLAFADRLRFHGIGAILAGCFGLMGLGYFLKYSTYTSASQRIQAWLNPELYANDYGYQTLLVQKAREAGGLFGVGIGQGNLSAEYSFAWSENIFALILEETGWFGGCLVVLAFGILLWQMLRVTKLAVSMKQWFWAMVTWGVLLHIGLQAVTHVAVNLNLLPMTSCVLPFLSYNGSTVVFFFGEMGLVFSAARYLEIEILDS